MTDLKMLKMAETRQASVLRDFPESAEVTRFETIITLMKADLSPDELSEYTASKQYVESADDKKTRIRAEQYAMSMNRDSESI